VNSPVAAKADFLSPPRAKIARRGTPTFTPARKDRAPGDPDLRKIRSTVVASVYTNPENAIAKPFNVRAIFSTPTPGMILPSDATQVFVTIGTLSSR
jgi:hypothetical protein